MIFEKIATIKMNARETRRGAAHQLAAAVGKRAAREDEGASGTARARRAGGVVSARQVSKKKANQKSHEKKRTRAHALRELKPETKAGEKPLACDSGKRAAREHNSRRKQNAQTK